MGPLRNHHSPTNQPERNRPMSDEVKIPAVQALTDDRENSPVELRLYPSDECSRISTPVISGHQQALGISFSASGSTPVTIAEMTAVKPVCRVLSLQNVHDALIGSAGLNTTR